MRAEIYRGPTFSQSLHLSLATCAGYHQARAKLVIGPGRMENVGPINLSLLIKYFGNQSMLTTYTYDFCI